MQAKKNNFSVQKICSVVAAISFLQFMHRHVAITPYWCGDSAQSADSLFQLPDYLITDDALIEEGRYRQQLNMFSIYENRPRIASSAHGPGCVTSLISIEHFTSSIFANFELNFDLIDKYSDVDKFD